MTARASVWPQVGMLARGPGMPLPGTVPAPGRDRRGAGRRGGERRGGPGRLPRDGTGGPRRLGCERSVGLLPEELLQQPVIQFGLQLVLLAQTEAKAAAVVVEGLLADVGPAQRCLGVVHHALERLASDLACVVEG